MVAAELSEADVQAKLAALGELDDETRNGIVCALIGHSRICTAFFGYQYCGRCGTQVGDNLAGVPRYDTVVVAHNCETCRANFAKCDWRDTLYTPDPFKTDDAVAA